MKVSPLNESYTIFSRSDAETQWQASISTGHGLLVLWRGGGSQELRDRQTGGRSDLLLQQRGCVLTRTGEFCVTSLSFSSVSTIQYFYPCLIISHHLLASRLEKKLYQNNNYYSTVSLSLFRVKF